MGASYVARAFSGNKQQLIPLLKAGLSNKGFAMVDVISPCVTFNDHEGSTKSYAYSRKHFHTAIRADFVPPAEEIVAEYDKGNAMPVTLHDGSRIVLRQVGDDYDPTDVPEVYRYLEQHQAAGEFVTGLLYLDNSKAEMHELSGIVDEPLSSLDHETLCPGSDALRDLQEGFR